MLRLKLPFGYTLTIKRDTEHTRKDDMIGELTRSIDWQAAADLSNEIVTDSLISKARAMRAAATTI